jgi:uncharacterized repeat protein (TIGR02543 family)
MENGAPIAYAEAFYRVKERTLFDVELKTVIMIDISLSVGSSNIEKLKDSVKSIINNKSDNQSIAIYTFSGNVTMVKDFTLDKTELIAAVNGITLGASSTNLYGAIYDGLDRFVNTISNKLVTNTFMIVMTDGQDTSAVRSLEEALTKRGDRSVITVGIGSDVDPETLSSLGNFGSFMAADFDTLQTYIDEARALITETYENVCWMTYYSPKRAGSHTIEVSIKNNSNTGETSKISGVFSASDPQFYDAAPGIYINDSYLSQTGDSEIAFADSDASKTLQINSYFGANEPEYTFELSIPGAYSISEIIPVLKKSYSLTRVDGGNATITIRDTANNYSKTLNITGKGYVELNFNSTGGSAIESQRIFEGNLATKPSNPTRTGYTFSGWYKESTFANLWNFNVDTVNADKTLYAKWTAKQYSITFDKQSGTGGTNSVTATYDAEMPTATKPTREGYTFGGYWDATSGGTQYYTASMASLRSWDKTTNTTLYAGWTMNSYTVTFNSNGGSAVTPQTIEYGGLIAQPSNPTKTGYTFSGWYKESTFTNLWDFNVDTVNANTTLYAKWTGKTYNITFDKQSGTGGTNSVTATYGAAMPTATKPTRTGYTFGGYWDATSGGTQYYTSSMTSARSWDKTENTTLYARWTINSYTVTFNSNGGSAVTSQTIEYGGLIAQPSNPTKTGYTFSGWYKESTFTNLWGFNVDTVNSDKTLYAKFTDALWAKSVTAGNDTSSFSSVAVDSSGNVYAAGRQWGTGSFTYGEGVSVAGTYADDANVVLVKYDSSGTALWAKSVTAGTNRSSFNSVAVDSSGNVYAAGRQSGSGSYTYGETYGEGVSVAGSYSNANVVLVKYDSSGVALWAKSVTAGTNESRFNSVAVDSSGNVYAAGIQWGTGSLTYGEGVSVAGGSYAGYNVVLVKYDSSGTALWAKSVTAGNDTSSFSSVAVDSSGNIYAAGLQKGAGSYTYGAGVSVAGTYADINGSNVVLVKYNSSGAALWAKSVTAGTDWSGFYSVAVDSSGNVYAAGYQRGTGSYTYGPGVSVAGTYSAYNVVLVKYNSSGTALWAKSVTAGNNRSQFNSVAVDSSGNVYAAGCQYGTGSYTYGEGVSVAGSYSDSDNVVLVKYGATP